jgi:hypothetical protein
MERGTIKGLFENGEGKCKRLKENKLFFKTEKEKFIGEEENHCNQVDQYHCIYDMVSFLETVICRTSMESHIISYHLEKNITNSRKWIMCKTIA